MNAFYWRGEKSRAYIYLRINNFFFFCPRRSFTPFLFLLCWVCRVCASVSLSVSFSVQSSRSTDYPQRHAPFNLREAKSRALSLHPLSLSLSLSLLLALCGLVHGNWTIKGSSDPLDALTRVPLYGLWMIKWKHTHTHTPPSTFSKQIRRELEKRCSFFSLSFLI